MSKRTRILSVAVMLVLVLIGGGTMVATSFWPGMNRTRMTAYFTNSTGIFPGDEVRILGVAVGKIDAIETQPDRVKITFWVDDNYKVPAQAKAVILSPSLISARAIQLVPAYEDGPIMQDLAVIPLQRTAVPVEWDDLRGALEELVDTLQPTQPGGVSTLGAYVNTAADNLRGQGVDIHDTIVKMSQAFSALGDHSDDVFRTISDLSTVVTALRDSKELMRELNENLAATTAVLADQPDEVGTAVTDINDAAEAVQTFVADNREALGITSDQLASISTTLEHTLEDIKQTLHIAPHLISNFVNIYPPGRGGFAGALSLNNFANPLSMLCGAIQAASRLNAEQSAKLCVQYLAPIVKNRQINFLPLGMNPVVGADARPNEITYSEDWLRPDYVPPPQTPDEQASAIEPGTDIPPLAAEISPPAVHSLPDMLLPSGAGS